MTNGNGYIWPDDLDADDIINLISDENGLNWDTTSTVHILSSFINDNCSIQDFTQHVKDTAIEDLEEIEAVENGE